MTVQSKPPVSHRLLNLKTSLQSLPHQDPKAPNGYDIKHNEPELQSNLEFVAFADLLKDLPFLE